MQVAGLIGGGGPLTKRYMAGTDILTGGVPVIGAVDAATDLGSVEVASATGATALASQVGLCLSVTSGTTIAATGIARTDEIFVEVVVNPDLIINGRANQGTTSGTALAQGETSGASSSGVVATGVTTLDNGWMVGNGGANAGVVRRTDDAVGGVSINLPSAVAIGDKFVAIQGFPCGIELTNVESMDLTTDLTELVADVASVTNDNFLILDIFTDLRDATTKTFYQLIQNSHLFGSSSIA